MKSVLATAWIATQICLIFAQQQCYYGAGAQYRGPSELVPCNGTGVSACCLSGDTCLSGNTCYNFETGNLYQYGCTDINYQDDSCPRKCGFDASRSPWTALEYCDDVQDLSNTWVCHGPESCGCNWQASDALLTLQRRGCKDMGSDAYVALYAPSALAPYVSLPSSIGGSTGYYSPTVSAGSSGWVSTAVAGYTPTPFTQLTTYRAAPTTRVQVDPTETPGPSTYASAASYTAPSSKATSGESSGTVSSSSTTSPSLATTSSAASTGLSTGAKAGIGGGVAGGVCLLAALGICWYLVRRRKKTQVAPGPAPPPVQQLYPGSPYSHIQAAPPYPHSPPIPGSNWSPYPQGGDPYYNYHYDISSPRSNVSRDKPHREPSFISALPVPSPPTELAGEAIKPVHEIGDDTNNVDSTASVTDVSGNLGHGNRI